MPQCIAYLEPPQDRLWGTNWLVQLVNWALGAGCTGRGAWSTWPHPILTAQRVCARMHLSPATRIESGLVLYFPGDSRYVTLSKTNNSSLLSNLALFSTHLVLFSLLNPVFRSLSLPTYLLVTCSIRKRVRLTTLWWCLLFYQVSEAGQRSVCILATPAHRTEAIQDSPVACTHILCSESIWSWWSFKLGATQKFRADGL